MTSPPDWPNMNYAWSGLLIEELVRLGVAGFVLSPGSRNSPLALSVAQHPGARHWTHFDERGAGFFALGLARRTGQPGVLVCTSGSAGANYWPAVVEADAAGIPLIIITADRPPELLDCGANQAIDQPRMYGRYVRWEGSLPCPAAAIDPAYVLTTADQAHAQSLGANCGPVHLNCMFREPLAPVADASLPPGYLDGLAVWRPGKMPYTRVTPVAARLDDAAHADVLGAIQSCGSGLLIVGALANAGETALAAAFARKLGWPVFADVCSGLRGHPDLPQLITYGDLVLLDPKLADEWRPAVVLHAGGPVTSKRIQSLLEHVRPRYLRVAPGMERLDPGHRVTTRIPLPASVFFAEFGPLLEPPASVHLPEALKGRNAQCRAALEAWHAAQENLSEIAVARSMAEHAPAHSQIFLGNSMPVRLLDAFGEPAVPDVDVAANRGASGIDGNIATAVGMALASGRPTAALTGDLTALHDLNSLALLRHIETPFALIILNNDGGGIFHHLPIAQYPDSFEQCFGTPHGLGFPGAATMFNIPYRRPATLAEFDRAFGQALATPGPTLIEVTMDRYTSRSVHEAMRERLRTAMNQRRAPRESAMNLLKPSALAGTAGQPPLLLLHGFLGELQDWIPAARALGADYRVLGVNLPGHGPGWRDCPVDTMDVQACAEGIIAGLDELGIEQTALAGYSMGGRLALYLAMHYPDRVSRLVMESASPGMESEEKRVLRAAQDATLADRLSGMAPRSPEFRAFLEEWYAMPLFATLQGHPETLAALIAHRHATGMPHLLAQSLRGMGTGAQPGLWPKLAEFTTPTLLLAGEADRKFRIIAEDMCRACPAMAIEVLSGCGHNIHLENPGAWLTVVRAFLRPA